MESSEDEDLAMSLSVGDGRHLVDLGSPQELVVNERCLLELLQMCRSCGRKCAVRKQLQGLKLEISQFCVHCQYRWNWCNLPDDHQHRLHPLEVDNPDTMMPTNS